ncbi:hypothetical protein C8R43DRAFT_965278 [Mycena crocata]|nr:hypothetical protein C8R43DRAFT_965278 [Mycena crocata]
MKGCLSLRLSTRPPFPPWLLLCGRRFSSGASAPQVGDLQVERSGDGGRGGPPSHMIFTLKPTLLSSASRTISSSYPKDSPFVSQRPRVMDAGFGTRRQDSVLRDASLKGSLRFRPALDNNPSSFSRGEFPWQINLPQLACSNEYAAIVRQLLHEQLFLMDLSRGLKLAVVGDLLHPVPLERTFADTVHGVQTNQWTGMALAHFEPSTRPEYVGRRVLPLRSEDYPPCDGFVGRFNALVASSDTFPYHSGFLQKVWTVIERSGARPTSIGNLSSIRSLIEAYHRVPTEMIFELRRLDEAHRSHHLHAEKKLIGRVATPGTKESYIGAFLENIIYGVYLSVFLECCVLFWRKNTARCTTLKLAYLLITAALMFVLITVRCAIDTLSFGALNTTTTLGLTTNACWVAVTVVADAFIILRTFVVWNRRWLPILLPAVLCVADFGLIAFRIVWVYREVARMISGSSGRGNNMRVVSIIDESGMYRAINRYTHLYADLDKPRCTRCSSPEYFSPTGSQGLVFSYIIIRVSRGTSYGENSEIATTRSLALKRRDNIVFELRPNHSTRSGQGNEVPIRLEGEIIHTFDSERAGEPTDAVGELEVAKYSRTSMVF